MAKKIKIYSVFHKESPHSTAPLFENIQVGKAISGRELSFVADNTGEHISYLNAIFCELTALYWVWKNEKELPEYIGLCHYRRYFHTNLFWWLFIHKKPRLTANQFFKATSFDRQQKRFLSYLGEYDFVLPKKMKFPFSIEEQYFTSMDKEPWLTMLDVLKEFHPADFEKAQTYFRSARSIHAFNMFITKREIFLEYMEWLFPILFEVKNRITEPSDAYQKRYAGFLAERLLNLFVHLRGYKVKDVPFLFLKG